MRTLPTRNKVKLPMTVEPANQFVLPIYFDLGATFLYALTGALMAIRRHYDMVGLFVLALVSGLGGGLIRDSIFIQNGPPVAMKDERYLYVVIAGCLAAALFGHRMDRLQRGFLLADALGLGAYAVVGVEKSLNAGLSILAAIMVGVVNAAGGGMLRDVLVREEPLLFKPGQLYVLAASLGAGLFTALIVHFNKPVEVAALLAVGVTFVFRLLAITFNWKTVAVAERLMPITGGTSAAPSPSVSVLASSGAPAAPAEPAKTPPSQSKPNPAPAPPGNKQPPADRGMQQSNDG
jgi:uncharacterized membrane protein YeiH